MEQPFYIGQKVVCIKSHSWGLVKKGVEYTIKYIGSFKCGCVWVSVEVINDTGASYCGCSILYRYDGLMRFSPQLFAPLQEGFEAITFERVMEEEKVSVN